MTSRTELRLALSFSFLVVFGSLGWASAAPEDSSESGDLKVPEVHFGFSTTYLDRPEAESGALRIDRVTEGSPAESAGLKAGDQIVAFEKVPFRFENDAAAFRGLAWVEPEKPLRLTILRDGKALDIEMIPKAASAERIARNREWLRRAEARGGDACRPELDSEDACSIELHRRVEAVGGKAVVRIERLPGETAEFQSSSRDVELPAGFDWLKVWPNLSAMADLMEPGESFEVLIDSRPGRTEIRPLLEGTRWAPK